MKFEVCVFAHTTLVFTPFLNIITIRWSEEVVVISVETNTRAAHHHHHHRYTQVGGKGVWQAGYWHTCEPKQRTITVKEVGRKGVSHVISKPGNLRNKNVSTNHQRPGRKEGQMMHRSERTEQSKLTWKASHTWDNIDARNLVELPEYYP